jgi:hypothetical protein
MAVNSGRLLSFTRRYVNLSAFCASREDLVPSGTVARASLAADIEANSDAKHQLRPVV